VAPGDSDEFRDGNRQNRDLFRSAFEQIAGEASGSTPGFGSITQK